MHLMHVRRLRLFVYYIKIRPVKRLNRELYYIVFTFGDAQATFALDMYARLLSRHSI